VSEDADAQLDALLSNADPTSAEIETTLTLGHARALELEAERVRIQRRLERVHAGYHPALEGVIASTSGELQAVNATLRSLRGRLSDFAARFRPRSRFSDRVC
jgi:hypothetical protein